ncbi:Fe-S cluster assembly protein HesB [Actinomadura fibrosa]|uniref:Fe-S cluster assembly protein HesB n=1 Tax=Actinomadura fibrosa TaxID=111802 RepID=A0ABW2XAC2_9ACTN|nr:Fe-S cluster assembly protein HesB [Actinomadura fibrosa]
MLTLTGTAVEAIRILTTRPGVPEDSGLRIVHHDSAGGLELSITPGPDAGDQVIETDGVRVFLQTKVAAMLGGRALNAEIAEDDDVIFRITGAPDGAEPGTAG